MTKHETMANDSYFPFDDDVQIILQVSQEK